LRNAIKTKIEIDESTNIRLYFKENEKYIVLDEMEDLEEGMTIKVSVQSMTIYGKFTFFFIFPLKSHFFISLFIYLFIYLFILFI